MEVILRETIDNLGRAGQVVKVADGYARNYLLPRKLAYLSTPGNRKVIEYERQSLLRKEAQQKDDSERLASRMRYTDRSQTPMWPKNSRKRAFRSRSGRSIWTTTSRLSANSQFLFVCLRTSSHTSS